MKPYKKTFTPPTLREPHRWRGMRIGLFGGSFNPIHDGHLHVASIAQKQFGLDFVWWLVTPQNPLKEKVNTAPYQDRFMSASKMLCHAPRHIPTHIEAELNTQYTYQTITALKKHFPKTDFIWICGMDNAHIFHEWDQWQKIIKSIPITFVARPPAQTLVKSCPLRHIKYIPHKFETFGQKTNIKKPMIYWLSGSKMLDISSTEIRKRKAKSIG